MCGSGIDGNFNSWDRQPFLTDVGSGVTPEYLEIRYNFLISNYGAGFGVDNDDTSSYYKIHHNFMYVCTRMAYLPPLPSPWQEK